MNGRKIDMVKQELLLKHNSATKRHTQSWFRMLLLTVWIHLVIVQPTHAQTFYPANHAFIKYTGRIDFSNPQLPRFWQPGVSFQFRFKGNQCTIVLNDEMLWGNKHNYIEVVLDGKEQRLQTKGKTDTLLLQADAATKLHTVAVYKNTEANIGYLELVGIQCQQLVKPLPLPQRKIECIGNSITCGTGSDMAAIPCGKGLWEDQHNAYMSYGAIMARQLNAQCHLSAVSGIGLMRSCCNMDIIMPQVFDKISMRDNKIAWNFNRYQPQLVTISLGQNDGVQDSAAFCNNYIAFVKKLRTYYPRATILLLSSPMADNGLRNFMRSTIPAITKALRQMGEAKLYYHIFEKQYSSGCDYHPSLQEHQQIAQELVPVIKKIMRW